MKTVTIDSEIRQIVFAWKFQIHYSLFFGWYIVINLSPALTTVTLKNICCKVINVVYEYVTKAYTQREECFILQYNSGLPFSSSIFRWNKIFLGVFKNIVRRALLLFEISFFNILFLPYLGLLSFEWNGSHFLGYRVLFFWIIFLSFFLSTWPDVLPVIMQYCHMNTF